MKRPKPTDPLKLFPILELQGKENWSNRNMPRQLTMSDQVGKDAKFQNYTVCMPVLSVCGVQIFGVDQSNVITKTMVICHIWFYPCSSDMRAWGMAAGTMFKLGGGGKNEFQLIPSHATQEG